MAKKPDALSEKFKDKETTFRSKLPKDSIVGIRLDGKAFHTFTKQFERPYDTHFMKAMDDTAIFIIENLLTSSEFAYVQSDEITIFFTDWFSENSNFPNDGKIEKLLSTSASAATGGFMTAMPECSGVPVFDSRIFVLEDLHEIKEYMDWRRMDAFKNSITMSALTLYSEKELNGVNTRGRLERLKGTELEILPEGFIWGRMIVKDYYEDLVQFRNNKTQKLHKTNVGRSRWVSQPATRSNLKSFMESLWKKAFEAPLGY